MALPELIDFQDSKWIVRAKIEGQKIDDHTTLKSNYGCDLVLKNSQNVFFILDKVIDVEFEDT
tara:strand:+ start:681 stop:869 length:189 start_codon:yes stop_codon:yes gene_type:complete